MEKQITIKTKNDWDVDLDCEFTYTADESIDITSLKFTQSGVDVHDSFSQEYNDEILEQLWKFYEAYVDSNMEP